MAEAARQRLPSSAPPQGTLVGVLGVVMELLPEGALWWAEPRMLVVADLHLEKGSSFARRGQMIPPYDTHETLAGLTRLVDRLDPRVVVALGDSFHDEEAATRLSAAHLTVIRDLQIDREWVWIAGNHDPNRPAGIGGTTADELAIGKLTFRHEPKVQYSAGEIAGHLHPCARVFGRGKSVRRRCFVGDGHRLILPAFGAYTGGLDVLDDAFDGLFVSDTFRAFMLGDDQIYPVGLKALRAA